MRPDHRKRVTRRVSGGRKPTARQGGGEALHAREIRDVDAGKGDKGKRRGIATNA